MLTMATGVNLTGVNIPAETFANLIDSVHLPLYDEAQIWVEQPRDATCGIQASLILRPDTSDFALRARTGKDEGTCPSHLTDSMFRVENPQKVPIFFWL